MGTQRSHSRLWRACLALGLSALVLAPAACNTRRVDLPPVAGLRLAEAETRLRDAGFVVGEVAYNPASTQTSGTVLSAKFEDERPAPGSAVDLVLAGPRPVEVPALVGGEERDVQSILVSSGLEKGTVKKVHNARIPLGIVISQEPTSGTTVGRGSAVNLIVSLGKAPIPSDALRMKRVRTITGGLSPKSVVAGQNGLVFAQNMIYGHTVAVFDDKTYKKVKTISDKVSLADFGFPQYNSPVRGGPVEAAVTPDGKHLYVSNYSMYGPGFSRPGDDVGGPGSGVDKSFVYRVDLSRLEIDQAIKVGSVPKYVAVTPDGRYALVANWISYSLSVIDTTRGKTIREIPLGPYPRGIAVSPDSKTAYVAVMGSTRIAKVNLGTFKVTWLDGVGPSPRHLVMSPDGRYLYVTLNSAGTITKIDTRTGRTIDRVATGREPRSMTMAADGRSLYVVNYSSNTVSKVRTSDMTEMQEIPVPTHPIGIAYVDKTREIWVACYTGSIIVFKDSK